MQPYETTTELMPWQAAAVEKLKPTRVGGLFMEMGTGKALPLDSKVLTPNGWKLMGDINEGDDVIGADGKPTQVVGVYPQGICEIFKVTFSDKSEAQCTKDHLWQVITPLRKWRGMSPLVMSLDDIIKTGLKHANGNRKYQIPLVNPVEFEKLDDLPVDPYLLGVLLGDAHLPPRGGPLLSNPDEEIIQEVVSRLPPNMRASYKSSIEYNLCGVHHGKNPLMDRIRKLGLSGKKSDEKFIPRTYLFAPVKSRILLLQGLMDTDGTPDNTGCEYVTTSERLAEDIKFLVYSLGGLVNIALKNPTYEYKGEKRKGKLAYRLYIRFSNSIQPFKLSRKRVECRTKYNPTRSIESVELLGHKPAQCIKVAATDGLFVTDDFIVTHNTLTAIEIVRQRAHKIDRVVWFCPVSLKDTVRLEILKHTNCGPADIYKFDDRTTAETLPAPEAARWVIIGIESLSSSYRVTFAAKQAITEKTCVILDESSYIKGHRAKRTERAILLAEKCKYRFVLTGTPISQGVEDLFTQMKFLSPKILGYRSWYTFARNHLEYSKHHPGLIVRALDTDQLAAKIAPYVYQVTKAECMDLPGKKHDHRYFKMTKEQQAAYNEAKEELLFQMEIEAVNGEVFKPYTLFRLFSVLQQIACGFWNHRITNGLTIDPNDTYEFRTFPDNRLDTMLDLIRDTIPAGEKIIIWAKFRYDIRRIVSALRDIYGPDSVAVFTGYTKQRDRQAEVDKFRGPARFFVSTQSCGGHGLTLNEAHHVIFYSNSFKYAERQQAEDRCHRMGQEQEVRYYDILGPGIDDKIWEALSRKENAVDAFRREVEAVKESRAKVKDLVKLL